jgi:hypothetical protein
VTGPSSNNSELSVEEGCGLARLNDMRYGTDTHGDEE